MAIRITAVLLFSLCLVGCQETLLSDDRIVSNTAGILGVPPSGLTISDRRTEAPTTTSYVAHTKSGETYACSVFGGGLLAFGITDPPKCAHPTEGSLGR